MKIHRPSVESRRERNESASRPFCVRSSNPPPLGCPAPAVVVLAVTNKTTTFISHSFLKAILCGSGGGGGGGGGNSLCSCFFFHFISRLGLFSHFLCHVVGLRDAGASIGIHLGHIRRHCSYIHCNPLLFIDSLFFCFGSFGLLSMVVLITIVEQPKA